MRSIDNHAIGSQSGRNRSGLVVVLSALLFWSNAALAAWCSDPDVHWLHPGQDEIGLQSKNTLGHRETPCEQLPANRIRTLPTKFAADDYDPSSPGASVDSTAGGSLVQRWLGSYRPNYLAFVNITNPPLYLIYQRLLIPFAA